MRLVKKLTGIGLVGALFVMISAPCFAAGDSPWMIRLRALGIMPDDDSSNITVIGGKAEVDEAYTVDLDFTYFFTDNIAAELVLAYAQHDVGAVNTAIGDIDLGTLDLLPPTLVLQYHFMPGETISPYVGAGASFVLIPDEDPGDVATSIEYDDAVFGLALQAGVDYFINDNLCINFDVKKVWVDVDVTVGALGTFVETNVDVDPWLLSVGIGYRF